MADRYACISIKQNFFSYPSQPFQPFWNFLILLRSVINLKHSTCYLWWEICIHLASRKISSYMTDLTLFLGSVHILSLSNSYSHLFPFVPLFPLSSTLDVPLLSQWYIAACQELLEKWHQVIYLLFLFDIIHDGPLPFRPSMLYKFPAYTVESHYLYLCIKWE